MNTGTIMARGMRFLFEADAYALAHKFENALRLYEAQIITLRSEKTKDVKMLSLCYGRLGKLFLQEERYDRAILEYDHQLSLAREINDKPEEAEAHLGMGLGYLGRYNYADSVRYLEMAQVQYNHPKYAI